MSVFISLKKSVIFLIVGFICAAAAAFLIVFFLSGPKLGPVFDYFLGHRQKPPVSQEILIINTDEYIDSADIFSVLMTLTEMEASYLVCTSKVAGSSSLAVGNETELRLRFFDEYALLGSNIRNLFDAIRSGSVSSVQAPLYIERLVELSEQSRDRLILGLTESDENIVRSAAVFGNYLEMEARAVFDWDGKLRRVQPVETESSLEHPLYSILKKRYAVSQIKDTRQGKFLLLREYNGNEFEIPLDSDGNILLAGKGRGFRSIDISLFHEYEDAGRVMRSILKEAGELGAFSVILPEYSPLFLDDYAVDLRQELIKEPDMDKRLAWINTRSDFFKSLDDYLYGPAEMFLIRGYEEAIAGEYLLNNERLARLTAMRDRMINLFSSMRNQHSELIRLRARLADELASSFCIMGTRENTEYSALLANVLITCDYLKPVYDLDALYWSAAAVFFILLIIFRLQPVILLITGLCSSVLAAASFGLSFVFSGYWVEPLIVFGSTLTGTLIIFCCRSAAVRRSTRCLRTAYSTAVSNDALRKIIRSGRPQLSEVTVTSAAIIAIKDFHVLTREDHESPKDAGNAQRQFYNTARKMIFDAGAVITGYEKDTIFACFGSPLDKTKNPALKAYAFVKELLSEKKVPWYFGMDEGECAFSWSSETGFTANGKPVVQAKILVSKTVRLKERALITETVREKINMKAKKTGSLYNGAAFYKFPQ